jgi:hypothetical protein
MAKAQPPHSGAWPTGTELFPRFGLPVGLAARYLGTSGSGVARDPRGRNEASADRHASNEWVADLSARHRAHAARETYRLMGAVTTTRWPT